MTVELIGKVAGYLAIVTSVIIYQQKTRPRLLICKAIADALWITHYLLLGAYTGAAVTGVALVREILFFKTDRKSKLGKLALVCFLCISIGCSALTWSTWFSVFAMLGSLLSIVSFWIGEPKISRRLSYPISACMLTYGVSNGSVAVLINEILVMSSSTYHILKYDRKQS